MSYFVIHNVDEERLKIISFEGETWRRLMGRSPYMVSSEGRIWYQNTIYSGLTLDEFFEYVLHKGENDYESSC